MRQAAAAVGRTIKLRIHVTGLDAMCRMIDNGLGVGVMPHRAFDLMNGVGSLESIALQDDWAERQIQLVARDFSTLPLTARLLVAHLTQKTEQFERPDWPDASGPSVPSGLNAPKNATKILRRAGLANANHQV